MLRLVHHQGIPEDQALQLRWDELVLQMDEPQVFFTYEWALAVSQAYGYVLKPLLFLAYDGECLVGVAALAVDSENHVSFLAGTTADYCDFICHPSAAGEFSDKVFEALRELGLSNVTLANLPADSPTAIAIRSATRRHGYRIFSRPAYLCAQIRLSSPEERQTLKLSTGKKKVLRQSFKALAKLGPVSVVHSRCVQDIEKAFPEFATAHVARFLATGRMSNLVRPERREFLSHLIELLGPREWLTLSCLTVGDRSIAWNFGFQFSGSWFYYQPTFDSSLQQFSPGLCLLSKIVEDACDDSAIAIIDLGLGAEGYKERFATQTRQTLHVTISRSAARHAQQASRYHLACGIKSMPRIESAIRRVRDSLQSSRSTAKLVSPRMRHQSSGQTRHANRGWLLEPPAEAGPLEVGYSVQPLTFEILATTAMNHPDDRGLLEYAMEVAGRLRAGEKGLAVFEPGGNAIYFCWTCALEEFCTAASDLADGAEGKRAVLFDGKDLPVRGTQRQVASAIDAWSRAQGMTPLVHCGIADQARIVQLVQMGFTPHFSLTGRRLTSLSKARAQELVAGSAKLASASSSVRLSG